MDTAIAKKLASVKNEIGTVNLVAVSKSQLSAKIEEALQAGQKCFGENRVQEARGKWPDLKNRYPDVELHLIGPLQTNKVREALEVFDVLHTLDRPRLADALAKAVAGGSRNIPCLVQVNTGKEAQKSGVFPEKAGELIRYAQSAGLRIKGLMCIPPNGENPVPHFSLLGSLAKEYALPWLSMGMSADYREAIAAGATHVRIGTAIFGERH